MSHQKALGLALREYKRFHGITLKMLEAETGIPHATLWQVEQDLPVFYEIGKILEGYLKVRRS